ncbi:MAG: DUF58 domain-containing protein [Bacteroidota bacterium]
MDQQLLDNKDLQLISRLSLVAKRRMAGLITGEQHSPVQGGGIEFADYREYQPGDDIRRIDWSVFLRLHRLLVKLCAEEKELTLMMLIDNSRSMRYGNPDKLWLAERIAAILAGIAFNDGNRAGIAALGQNLTEIFRPGRSRASLSAVSKALLKIEPVAMSDPVSCIRQFASRYGHKCLAVLFSDLLFPEWPQLITGLAASGCEGYLIQILAPEELDPAFMGEVTLIDLEGKGEISLHADLGATQKYRRELASFLQEVRKTCHRNGLGHTMIGTDAPLARILQKDLRKEGILC